MHGIKQTANQTIATLHERFTCMRAIKRKKALAARLICSYRKRGRKVNTPYLVVLQQRTGGETNTRY